MELLSNSAFCVLFFIFLAFVWSVCHEYGFSFKCFIMLSMFSICVCVCLHVCLCVQMRSCQALAACIDVVMEVFLILSWRPAAASNGQLKTILWWFYGLLHVLYQNFVTWCGKILSSNPAVYVIHRHFSIIFWEILSLFQGLKSVLACKPCAWHRLHFSCYKDGEIATPSNNLDCMSETNHPGSSK